MDKDLVHAIIERDRCRAIQVEGNGHSYENGWGALIGELDWEAEIYFMEHEGK